MEKAITELSCGEFTEALASKAPVPGGGGAAAMLGALSAALCEMAGNLTVGKKKYADVEGDVRLLVDRAECLRLRFLALIGEDAAAFAPLAAAYAIPRSDPDCETTLRGATLRACEAPLEMMRCACEAVELLAEMREKGSRLLLSDVGCGAAIAGAALESAALNVFVNTRLLPGDPEACRYADMAESMLTESLGKARAISNAVLEELGGGKHG